MSPHDASGAIHPRPQDVTIIPFHLRIEDHSGGRGIVRLPAGTTVTLGRAPTNHVVVNDERASRFHAEILPTGAGWSIRDLGSRNGTFVGGRLIEGTHPLAPGDVIAIGLMQATLEACEPMKPAPLAPLDPGTASMSDLAAPTNLSITHRLTESRLLDHLGGTAADAPRVGRAAAELCRLAFALGRADDLRGAARLAVDSAMKGVAADRGIVLLPSRAGDAAAPAVAPEPLVIAASTPEPWPTGGTPSGVVAAVLASDEALLASSCGTEAGVDAAPAATISAPIRAGGRPIGVMHLELRLSDRDATPDDLEFVMAVCDALGVAFENLAAREVLSTRLASTADENVRLRQRLGEETRMVVASPALRDVMAQVGRVAATRATVLVRGESGVGKELVARSIHESSDRRSGPFVCLNCAALSETLLESELFGHEKGAFTGATERKIGKFEAAHRGTLMLDEIGEMSPEIQAKFLRVLEGHPFERVGGSSRVQVDVRVVAATNRDLEEAVRTGEFRRDLYFRLKVVEILVPPLRGRPEDIEAIATHFLERFAAETGRRPSGFTPEASAALRAYHWPGNIRELRNCVERAVVLSQRDVIDVDDLVLSQLPAVGESGRSRLADGRGPFVPATIDEIERRHVLATLEAVGGNKTKAASLLGIERSTLDRKLAKWARA